MGVDCRSVAVPTRPFRQQGAQLGLVTPGNRGGPPGDIRTLAPGRRRSLRRDPGVKGPTSVIDDAHEAGLAVCQDLFRFSQRIAVLTKACRPAVPSIADRCWCPRRVITGRFDAELQSLVPTQIEETATGDWVGLHLDTGRLWQPVLGANEREDGFQAVGRSARAETILLLLNRLTELLLDVHLVRPFQEEQETALQRAVIQSRLECVRDRPSITTLRAPRCRLSHAPERSPSKG